MKVKGKIFKVGNSYGVRLGKHWVKSNIVNEGDELEIELPIKKIDAVNEILTRDIYRQRLSFHT